MGSLEVLMTDMRVLRPRYQLKQSDLIDWLAKAHSMRLSGADFPSLGSPSEAKALIERYGCLAPSISGRGFELADYAQHDFEKHTFYSLMTEPHGPGMLQRMRFFESTVNKTFEEFYVNEAKEPSDLVHVTCTGYLSPSAGQRLVAKNGWKTVVTHAYHMGCYASIPGIRIASGLLANSFATRSRFGGEKTRSDVVHTELTGIHFDPTQISPDQLVIQTLFADGNIRYSLQPKDEFSGSHGLLLQSVLEWTLPDSAEAMTWVGTEFGMVMTLSKEVPVAIALKVKSFVDALLAPVDRKRFPRAPAYAIHPGGPKIVELVKRALDLTDDETRHSEGVLRDYGNMSSATLPHIWERMLNDGDVPYGTPIVSMAFGPGLTMCGAVLVKVKE